MGGEGMKIWFDTEFIEDGRTIDLLSIGMVREDGETLYLEAGYVDKLRASEWVRDNVFPHLQGDGVTRLEIAERVKGFAGDAPEFWAYYASYDWVVLCQLYGTMMDLPDGWPMFCRDVRQQMAQAGIERIPVPKNQAHHALADALWLKEAYEWLQDYTS